MLHWICREPRPRGLLLCHGAPDAAYSVSKDHLSKHAREFQEQLTSFYNCILWMCHYLVQNIFVGSARVPTFLGQAFFTTLHKSVVTIGNSTPSSTAILPPSSINIRATRPSLTSCLEVNRYTSTSTGPDTTKRGLIVFGVTQHSRSTHLEERKERDILMVCRTHKQK